MLNKQSYVKSYGYELEWNYQYDPKMSLTLKYFLDLFTYTQSLEIKINPIIMNTLNAQIVVCKYHFPLKKPGLLDSRSRATHVYDAHTSLLPE